MIIKNIDNGLAFVYEWDKSVDIENAMYILQSFERAMLKSGNTSGLQDVLSAQEMLISYFSPH